MKMKKSCLLYVYWPLIGLLSSLHSQAQEVETLVQIDTDMGKIKSETF